MVVAALVVTQVIMTFSLFMTPPARNIIDPELSGDDAVKALKALSKEQRTTFVVQEQRRLSDVPLDVAALNNLAVLESLAGNTKSAEAYVLESASRTLRDVQSQLGALRFYLGNKDYAKAMFHLDGILVSKPEFGNIVFPAVSALLDDDAAAAELARTLNRDPPWRKNFVIWLNANDKNDQATLKLYGQLRKQGGGALPSELLEYLRTQMANKNYDRAYFVWLDSLDQTALLKVGNVFDGNFELNTKNQYFDWNLYPFENGEIGIVAKRDDNQNRVLRLSFYNSIKKFANIEQYLRIGPGAYQFEGEVAANGLRAEAGLKFVVSCADTAAALGESSAFRVSKPWEKFSFNFNVPDVGCQTQLLRLQSASTAVLEVKLEGEILFDSLKISTVDKLGDQQAN